MYSGGNFSWNAKPFIHCISSNQRAYRLLKEKRAWQIQIQTNNSRILNMYGAVQTVAVTETVIIVWNFIDIRDIRTRDWKLCTPPTGKLATESVWCPLSNPGYVSNIYGNFKVENLQISRKWAFSRENYFIWNSKPPIGAGGSQTSKCVKFPHSQIP